MHTFGYPLVFEICALQTCTLHETFQTQLHITFTGIERRGRSPMTGFTDPTTVWHLPLSTTRVTSQSVTALRPSLLFTSSLPPPPPPPPSPLPRDGIAPRLPTLMRYPLNLLSSNQAFLPRACNSVHSQGKQLCLLEVDFDFFTLHEFDVIMLLFLGNRCEAFFFLISVH